MGVGLGVQPGAGAPQGAHGALLAQCVGNVLQQGADVGALGAGHLQHIFVFGGAAAVGDAVDLDGAGLALHGLALAGQLVKGLAAHLDRRVHGRHLHLLAHELRQHGLQFPLPCRDGGRFQHRAGDVAGIGALAQPQHGAVSLVMIQLQVHGLAGTAAEHRQHAGGHGVQRAAVAQLAGAQHAAQLCHHIKTGPVHGLVHDQDALHLCVLLRCVQLGFHLG